MVIWSTLKFTEQKPKSCQDKQLGFRKVSEEIQGLKNRPNYSIIINKTKTKGFFLSFFFLLVLNAG